MAIKALAQQSAHPGLFGALLLEGAGAGIASPGCVCSQITALAPLGILFPEQVLWPPWLPLFHLTGSLNQHPHPAELTFQGMITKPKAEALNPQRSQLPLPGCFAGVSRAPQPQPEIHNLLFQRAPTQGL